MYYFWQYYSTVLRTREKTLGNIFIIHLKLNLETHTAICRRGGGGRGKCSQKFLAYPRWEEYYNFCIKNFRIAMPKTL